MPHNDLMSGKGGRQAAHLLASDKQLHSATT